eukprot:362266-Chlamydomonas_euryale.AAC.2
MAFQAESFGHLNVGTFGTTVQRLGTFGRLISLLTWAQTSHTSLSGPTQPTSLFNAYAAVLPLSACVLPLQPMQAICWGLCLLEEMKAAQWDDDLLDHGLCEEVVVGEGEGNQRVLFRGPRLKIGVDVGSVSCDPLCCAVPCRAVLWCGVVWCVVWCVVCGVWCDVVWCGVVLVMMSLAREAA